ncbi:hypothetical protein JHK82_051976 [Glycine max]|nr:hypothetical protein JHK86_051810 [Glycine max]KAG4937745.1 hypothetical protein JHK85_052664 [Glycine max]KAG5093198.1 hypothetical protein JHK82_051976 [Glycine max]KAG5096266.1 hypothetical protein JHK84_051854 [Glycine max]
MSGQSAKRIPLRDAVSKYRLRFRQHLANEMVTMLLTVGMQRLSAPLVGLSVLALLTDLHTICVLTRVPIMPYLISQDKSGVLQVAREKFSEPKEVEKELGLAFKGNPRMVVEAHEVTLLMVLSSLAGNA